MDFAHLFSGALIPSPHFPYVCTKKKRKPLKYPVINGRNQAQRYKHPVELWALTDLTDFIVANLSARNKIRNELEKEVSIALWI